jgi:serine/threonine protein kinase/Tol biopolymer transport system component
VTGRTISHYRLLAELGRGGMGVVYKAHDTHLDRPVAIKVLPPERVENPERKRRFVQEAKAASALNHPNIVHIYDIGTDSGVDFIAMEYVEGRTLSDLIGRKGLKLGEALQYAVQVADALGTAHRAGIVHRDLKPANIMVNEIGLVKVLDFGLAKLIERGRTGDFASTQTAAATQTAEGTIVGTVSYMSPEQAQGKEVDVRSDVFSFGALLYEMLTGRRAFQGDSRISTLAAILHQEPEPAEQVASGIPPELGKILNRCLRKDPQRRAQSMADLKLALEELKQDSESGTRAAPPAGRSPKAWTRVWLAALLVALSGAAFWFVRSYRPSQAALQTVPLTTYPGSEVFPSFSPDGKQVAFSWDGEKQDNTDIYVQLIGSSGRPLRLTTDAADDDAPAWSPDGGSIVFVRHLKGRARIILVPALGGPERELIDLPDSSFSTARVTASWSPDGRWLVVPGKDSQEGPAALWLVSTESGEKRQLTRPPGTGAGDYVGAFSRDGRTVAFIRYTALWAGDLYVLPLDGNYGTKGEPRRLTNDNRLIYGIAWTANDQVVFSSNRAGPVALWRVSSSASGEPRRLSVGENGIHPSISRQGNRLAYSQSNDDTNIWRVNLSNPREAPVPAVSSTLNDFNPQYSPDGKRIAFASNRSGNIEAWVSDADGSNPAQLSDLGHSGSPRWSPDGQRIVIDSVADGNWQLFIANAHGGRPQRLTRSPANDMRPSWSQDGKWIYFGSNRSGGSESWQVWKMPADGGDAVQVTRHGGFNPFESLDGKMVYYSKDSSSRSPIWRVPANGGEETQVVDSAYFSAFAPSRTGIYYISRSVLQFFDFSTGMSKPILPIERPTHLGLAVSPDERWLLYSQFDRSGSDLMLVDNFR